MAAIGALQSIGRASQAAMRQELPGAHIAAPGDDSPSFADTLKEMLGEVSEVQANAEDAIGAFLRGENIEVHEVMAAAEEAGIALEMLIEIRNKLTEAYRTVSQMQ